MSIIKRPIGTVMLHNYIPYAKETIVNRALVYIDGFKPVQRRILYSMYEGKWFDTDNKRAKCARIVGDTMGKYHPHGDSSIYGALVNMTDDYNKLNAPYISGEGTFGRVWSRDLTAAAMRYTEASLSPISMEMFDGMKENAIDMIDNFDQSEKEPALLPTRFPNLIVNSSKGIAVGMAGYTPTYSLRSACDAVLSMIEGKSDKPEDLVDILGAPDFTTEGYVHITDAEKLSLIKTGKGTLTISGSVRMFKDKILITEVPFGATIEGIVDQIIAAVKDGRIKEISDVIDETGMNKKTNVANLGAVIHLKRGADPSKVLSKINLYSDLRASISFQSNIILRDGAGRDYPREMGIFDLLVEWIKWRMSVIKRQYEFKANKEKIKEHTLCAWELIGSDISKVAKLITESTEAIAKAKMMQTYGLDAEQAQYFLDKSVKTLTTDNMVKNLKNLAECRKELAGYNKVIENDKEKMNIMAVQIRDIRDKYGKDRKSTLSEPINVQSERTKVEDVIEDTSVNIFITRDGYVKRVINPNEILKVDSYLEGDDKIDKQISCSNKDTLLVFMSSGTCYKIPVYSIESTKSSFKEYIWSLIDKKDDGEIIYISATSDYTGFFNIVYNNGRGRRVWFNKAEGSRSRYSGLYEADIKDNLHVCDCDKFFIITNKKNAAYADLSIVTEFRSRAAFKVARVSTGDKIFGIQPAQNVPNLELVDLEKYSKGYCVKINDDRLW